MGLSVDAPEQPELQDVDPDTYEDTQVVDTTDYKREELSRLLSEGAWEEAWAQWTDDTDLTPDEYAIVTDCDLISQFDFFWDAFAERVGYHAPGIPEDWQERTYHPDLESWGTVSNINAELTALGQIVCDVLKDDYIEWESDYEPPEDLPDF